MLARNGKVIFITDNEEMLDEGKYQHVIKIKKTSESLRAVSFALPMQLIAYYTALEKGRDVDQPRNLAKSVTVE